MKLDACPCGRAGPGGRLLAYARCCGRYIDDFERTPAPDAESLMRSRYSAFVRECADYLRATWHPSERPATLDFEPGARWLGLEVRAVRTIDEAHAEVEFVARVRGSDGRATRLHERSLFVRQTQETQEMQVRRETQETQETQEQGGPARWYYLRALA